MAQEGVLPMQSNRIGAGCDASPNQTDDLDAQRIVLTQVLAMHPTHLPIPKLVSVITAGSKEFADSDNYERAIRDLNSVGLLDCPGGVVTPTPAALHADCVGVL
jgi:hypothetical protein